MSAQDNLGPQFFHASRYEFSPGDILTPSGAREISGSSRERSVFYSDDPAVAAAHGKNVYRVTPLSTSDRRRVYEPAPGKPKDYEYLSKKGVRVEGTVSDEEIKTAREAGRARFLNSPAGKSWAQEMKDKHGWDVAEG